MKAILVPELGYVIPADNGSKRTTQEKNATLLSILSPSLHVWTDLTIEKIISTKFGILGAIVFV